MRRMKIVTAEQMRRIDERTASDHGVSAASLMDNAGRAIAEALIALYPACREARPLILCGKGNNGGDGITAARYLRSEGVESRVVLLASRSALKGAAADHLRRAIEAGVKVEECPDAKGWPDIAAGLDRRPVVVDAILGTGLKGPARDLAALAIADINMCEAPVVSVDIPSGLNGDVGTLVGPAVRADDTIALACPKIAHVFPPASFLAGRLHIVDIGIPAAVIEAEEIALNLITDEDVWSLVPLREPDTHKGDFGHLLVIAGSTGKSGAAGLVCRAALRAGAGLVTAATTAAAQPILAGHVMEAMTEALPESRGAIGMAAMPILRDLMRRSDVLAIGPGLTTEEETCRLVREIVSTTPLPVILDADGVNAFAGRAADLRREDRVLILTPHPGEMARLAGGPDAGLTTRDIQADRVGHARRFARDHHCYLVLKGYRTVVADPGGEIWINSTGNPGMATAGSGDALTGILAALVAQGLAPLEACLLGVFLHGAAGDLAAADRGEISMCAGDLIEHLPGAFARLVPSPPSPEPDAAC